MGWGAIAYRGAEFQMRARRGQSTGGGSAVENFAVPMVFGVVVATTSSIFIAAPILLLLGDWWKHRHEREATTPGTLVKA
jgi:hypothetical protein